MNASLEKLLETWRHWPSAVEDVLQKTMALHDRAAAIARILHQLTPVATLAACHLHDENVWALAIESGDGSDRDERAQPLQSELARFDKSHRGVIHFPLGPGGKELRGLAAPIARGSSTGGYLILGVKNRAPAPVLTALETLLNLAAHSLSVCLECETADRRLRAFTDERRDCADLLTASDAMLGFVHEINNGLNSMILQASVMELSVDERVREGAAIIRRDGFRAAEKLAILQGFRERCRQSRAPTGLNQVVAEVGTEHPELAGRIQMSLADPSAVLTVNRATLKRFVDVLLRIVQSSQPEAGLKMRTRKEGNQVLLFIESSTANAEHATFVDFDGLPDEASGKLDAMEQSAAQALARLVGTNLRASLDSDGPLSLCASWTASDHLSTAVA